MGTEYSWFNVTTWAQRDWDHAQSEFWKNWRKNRGTRFEEQAHANLEIARAEYRHRILSWYRKLLLPMRLGDAVPNKVAELLAEEWDERTKWKTI